MRPSQHTAAEARQLLDSGAMTAGELARHYLERIEGLNPELNAVLAVSADSALAAAADSDARRRAGQSRGPLDGVPVLIKDNIEAVGLPGTAGSRALRNSPPATDAPLVSRLRGAGMVLLGSTNLSEWANFRSTNSTSGWSAIGGQTRNPHDPSRNTSGSSSGSAVAVAAGLAPLTVGTETDGSIVSPAGVCGVVGFKPTLGRVPGAGIVPISSKQDTAGPMGRTVADVAQLYAVLAGGDVDAALVDAAAGDGQFAGRQLSVWHPERMTDAAAEVVELAITVLGGAGAKLRHTHGASGGPFDDEEFESLQSEFAEQLPAYLAARPGPHPRTWPELLAFNRDDELELSLFSDEIFQRCPQALAAGGTGAAAYRTARAKCDAAAAETLAGVLGDSDFAITVTNSPAWPIRYGSDEEFGVLTSSLCAVTGSPSISLPGGSVDGLPVGISVLGRHGQDEKLLAFAAALEHLLPAPRYPFG